MRHKWSIGKHPNECLICGCIRTKETHKYLMAITNRPPYNHYKYISVTVYIDKKGNKTTNSPTCNND
jgi:hypothetical protein